MIILRNKYFGRENHRKLKENEKFIPNPDLVEIFGPPIIRIEADKKFSQDVQKLGPIDKKKLKSLKRDIKDGFIYNDGPAGGETEFLDFPGDKSHLMSKKIDNQHRFNYRVYNTEIIKDTKTGEEEYIQKIVYESCWGHETNGGRVELIAKKNKPKKVRID